MRLTRGIVFLILQLISQSAWEIHAQEKRSAPAGRQIFESTCASCHGLDGKGAERGPDISTRSQVVSLSNAEMLRILRDGIPTAGMPAFARLGQAKLSAVLRYLRMLQGRSAAEVVRGDAWKGEQLFYGNAHCSDCHMVKGQGGFLGPDLTTYGASLSAAEVRGAIVGTVGTGKEAEPRRPATDVTTRAGQALTGIVRNEDNFSLQLQVLDGTFHLLLKSEVSKIEAHTEALMPSDYSSKLSVAELDHLVAYLLTVARVGKMRKVPRRVETADDE